MVLESGWEWQGIIEATNKKLSLLFVDMVVEAM